MSLTTDWYKGIAEMFEKCPSVLLDNEKNRSFFLTEEQRLAVIAALRESAALRDTTIEKCARYVEERKAHASSLADGIRALKGKP